MLITASGESAGSLSGGCLEAEVTRKIAWLTRFGPTVEQYRSSFDDENDDTPYGLGCGGTIWILMESGPGAVAVLDAIERALEERSSSVAVSALTGRGGTIVAAPEANDQLSFHGGAGLPHEHTASIRTALTENRVLSSPSHADHVPAFLYTPITPPPRLTVFGAGDDAKPLVRFAVELGWHVTVADGRSHLLRRERFPTASHLCLLKYHGREISSTPNDSFLASELSLQSADFAVILTHSFEQDRALLRALLPLPLRYLGLLGPLHRTRRLVDEVAPASGLTPEQCYDRLHAPVGLDFGGGEASVIALSIVAEMQTVLAKTSGAVERKRSPSSALR